MFWNVEHIQDCETFKTQNLCFGENLGLKFKGDRVHDSDSVRVLKDTETPVALGKSQNFLKSKLKRTKELK